MTREQIIAELQYYREHWNLAGFEHYGETICNVNAGLIDAAVEALKAQGPRVMTYDELETFDGAFLLESSAMSELNLVFFFDTDSKSDAIWVEDFDGERYVIYREDYGKYTRCWTSRPTDEQREATPWKEMI